MTSFVGRDWELGETRRILRDERLLTLVGVGGVGKTRLATQLGAGTARTFPGGAWLVDLAPLRNGMGLLDAVSASIGLGPGDAAAVAAHLDRTNALLVLDNCEHLLTDCVRLVTDLLQLTSTTRILATSRQPLGMLGEHVFEVKPLELPEQPIGSPRHLMTFGAIRLFVDRAHSAVPGFALSPATATKVAAVCTHLDGVPLAIELTAQRLRTSSLTELLHKLDDRDLLDLSSRVAHPRQRSLRALNDWSYALCTPAERELWARLSVFEGTFGLADAQLVCQGEDIARDDVLDLLAELIDKSVVLRRDCGVEPRYRLTESIRQFGAEKLRRAGALERYRQRHAVHFAGVAEHLLDRLRDEGIPGVHRAVRRARRDFTTAAVHVVTEADFRSLDTLLRLVPVTPGQALADQLTGDYATEYAALRSAACGDVETAWDQLGAALGRHAERGDQFGLRQCIRLMAVLAWSAEDGSAVHRVTELAARMTGPGWSPLSSALAAAAHLRDDAVDAAEKLFAQALLDLRDTGDHWWLAFCLDGLIQCALVREDHSRAARLLGFWRSTWDSADAPHLGASVDPHRTRERLLRRECGDRQFAAARAAGAALSLDEVVEFATGTAPHRLDEGRLDEVRPVGGVPLTPREHRVAELVCEGLTNQAIGNALDISKRTVDAHVEHILRKLGLLRRTQIATWITHERAS
ncbi:helix-turn-helix transcriptional regulator [Labedaea rhizosphaerae]|nr:LuxR C-terminal-related transcriptional regulator [Labedaea rhizosphaerae]